MLFWFRTLWMLSVYMEFARISDLGDPPYLLSPRVPAPLRHNPQHRMLFRARPVMQGDHYAYPRSLQEGRLTCIAWQGKRPSCVKWVSGWW